MTSPKSVKLLGALIAVSGALFSSDNLSAANISKADNANALNLGSSWVNGNVPTSADIAVWDSTVTAANTVDLGVTTNWAGIQILSPGGAVNITNASTTLLLGASGVDTSAGSQTLTLSCPVALATNSVNNVWNLGSTVTLSGGLNGTNILEKTGSGTLNLSTGSGAATIQIDSGIVSVNTSSTTITNVLNGGTVNINVAASNPINVSPGGGTEQNVGGNRTWSGKLSGSGPLTVNASSTHTWNGDNSAYTGTITLQGSGTLRLSSVNSVSAGTAYSFNTGNMSANATGIFNLGSLGGSGSLFGGAGQNYSIGALNANTDFSGVISGATMIIKTGTATQTLSGANTYTGITVVSNGVLQIGNGGSSGALASPAVFLTNSTSVLSFNRGDAAFNLTNNITGLGKVQQDGGGTTFLSGPAGGAAANNYSGGTTLNAGTLEIAAGALGTGGITFNNSATLQWASGNASDISSQTVTINGATLDVNGNTVTLANPIGNSGSGLLMVKSTFPGGILSLQGANTYSGGTYVSSGKLEANNTTGSATGSGSVSVNPGAALGGAGIISGSVDLQGYLAPGNSVGTLTVGSLILEYNSTNDFEFNSTPANDKVIVTATDGLIVYGGVFNLYNEGMVTPWTAPGTYNLIQFSGTAPSLDSSWTTSSATNPHIGNPQTGYKYAFGTSGGFLTVSIALDSSAVVATWNVDADGNWTDATKWSSNPNVPHEAGDSATFGTGTTLRTVTLDANETNGAITMNNVNSFVIADSGKTLTLDNSGAGASLNVSGGTVNAIQTSLALNDDATIVVGVDKSLTISGVVSNSSTPRTISVSGLGTLTLAGNNSYGPAASSGFGTTLGGGGTLKVGHNNALGAGDVSIATSSTLQAGSAGLNIPNNFDIAFGSTATVDSSGNNLTLSGAITDGGSLTKNGNGVLTLGGTSSYSGNTTVNAGVLGISADSNVGSTPNLIFNGGSLLGNGTFALSGAHNIGIGAASGADGTNALIDAASGQTFEIDGIIGSAGNTGVNGLIVNSGAGDNGTLVLNNANTFNGTTVISNGTLLALNSFALQNSTLDYNSGTFGFYNISTATLGGLAGTNSLALTNNNGAAVTLTVGNNNASTTYGGNLNDSALGGSLIKVGTGTFSLTGSNVYNAATGARNGTLEVNGGSLTTSNSLFIGNSSTGTVHLTNNGSISVLATTLGGSSSSTPGFLVVDSGTGSFGNTSIGGSGNGGAIRINGGTASFGILKDVRDASSSGATLTSGVIINGGATTISNLLLSTGNSGADLTVSNGVLTIGDALTTGNCLIGAAGNTGRGGFLTVRGGTLMYLGADGMLLNNTNTCHGTAQFDGGISTFAGITMNNPLYLTGGQAVLGMNGGTVYLGNIGLVANTQSGGATASITLTSGTIGATADWSSTAPMTLAGNFTIQAADSNATPHNITLDGVLSGSGGITKTGNGTLTLSAVNSYTNNTTVSAGTLVIQQPFLSTNSIVSVSNGATLNLAFNVTNQVHGLVMGGTNKAAGVYNSTTDGAFLTGAGSLEVVQSVSLVPTNITATVSGNNLTLSWPADHTGWRLQSQTNSLSVGLASNWVDVAGSTSTNQVTIPIDSANGSVFFRIVYP